MDPFYFSLHVFRYYIEATIVGENITVAWNLPWAWLLAFAGLVVLNRFINWLCTPKTIRSLEKIYRRWHGSKR